MSQINKMIGRGIVKGETRRQVSARLTKAIKEQIGDGSKRKINGKLYDPGSYAELLARTRTREATTMGTKTFANQYGVYLHQVTVHERACGYCQQFHCKVYAIVEGTGFLMLDEEPPYHPNCECNLVPYLPAEEDDAEMRALKELSNSDTVLRGQDGYDEYMSDAHGR